MHAERHLVLRDARLNFGVVERCALRAVQRVDGGDGLALHLVGDSGRIANVEHRVADGVQFHALKLTGQQACRPLAGGDGLHLPAASRREEHDEPRQIFRVRAEAVENPRAHTGTARDDRPRIHDGVGRVVIDLLGTHGAHDAEVVGHAAHVRKQRAHLLAGLAELAEGVLRPEARQFAALKLRDLLTLGERFRHGLVMHGRQLRLIVEGLQMRRAARLVEEDDPLRLGRMMQRIDRAVRRRGEQARIE